MKKLGLLMMLFLFIGMFSLPLVQAAEPWDTIKSIVTLQFMTHLGFSSSLDPFEGLVRFLLLILMFTLFFVGAELLKLGRNASVVIALVFSLISAIFIPGSVLIAAAASYATIVSIVILGIPVLILFGSYFLLSEYPWVRFCIMAVAVWVIYQMMDHITLLSTGVALSSSHYGAVISNVQTPLKWVFGFAIAGLILSFFAGISRSGGGSAWHPNVFGRIWNRVHQKTALGAYTEKGKELRHARVEETRLLNDLAVEQKELELLRAGSEKLVMYEQIAVKEFLATRQVNSANHLDTFKIAMENTKAAMEAVKNIDHQWKRTERKEVGEMRRLIKEMAKNSVSDADRTRIEAEEQLLLNSYIQVNQAVTKALRDFDDVTKFHQTVFDACQKWYKRRPAPTPGRAMPSILNLTTLPAILPTLGKIDTKVKGMLGELSVAATAEDAAVKRTAALAKEIKDKWVVS